MPGLDAATTAAIVDDYESAQLQALKTGLLLAAFLALGSLATTRGLPSTVASVPNLNRRPGRLVALIQIPTYRPFRPENQGPKGRYGGICGWCGSLEAEFAADEFLHDLVGSAQILVTRASCHARAIRYSFM